MKTNAFPRILVAGLAALTVGVGSVLMAAPAPAEASRA